LARLSSLGLDYAACLSVASQFWISAVLLFILFIRQLSSLSRGVYLDLERDTVLRRLSAAEIEQRFTEEALGKPVSDWLGGIKGQMGAVNSKFRDIVSRYKVDLSEVEGIDPKYSLERQGRALKLVEKYTPEFKELTRMQRAIQEQLNQFMKVSVSVRVSPELTSVLNECESEARTGLAEIDTGRAYLEGRLSTISANPGETQHS
jgi:DNA repair ATPase RecN